MRVRRGPWRRCLRVLWALRAGVCVRGRLAGCVCVCVGVSLFLASLSPCFCCAVFAAAPASRCFFFLRALRAAPRSPVQQCSGEVSVRARKFSLLRNELIKFFFRQPRPPSLLVSISCTSRVSSPGVIFPVIFLPIFAAAARRGFRKCCGIVICEGEFVGGGYWNSWYFVFENFFVYLTTIIHCVHVVERIRRILWTH